MGSSVEQAKKYKKYPLACVAMCGVVALIVYLTKNPWAFGFVSPHHVMAAFHASLLSFSIPCAGFMLLGLGLRFIRSKLSRRERFPVLCKLCTVAGLGCLLAPVGIALMALSLASTSLTLPMLIALSAAIPVGLVLLGCLYFTAKRVFKRPVVAVVRAESEPEPKPKPEPGPEPETEPDLHMRPDRPPGAISPEAVVQQASEIFKETLTPQCLLGAHAMLHCGSSRFSETMGPASAVVCYQYLSTILVGCFNEVSGKTLTHGVKAEHMTKMLDCLSASRQLHVLRDAAVDQLLPASGADDGIAVAEVDAYERKLAEHMDGMSQIIQANVEAHRVCYLPVSYATRYGGHAVSLKIVDDPSDQDAVLVSILNKGDGSRKHRPVVWVDTKMKRCYHSDVFVIKKKSFYSHQFLWQLIVLNKPAVVRPSTFQNVIDVLALWCSEVKPVQFNAENEKQLATTTQHGGTCRMVSIRLILRDVLVDEGYAHQTIKWFNFLFKLRSMVFARDTFKQHHGDLRQRQLVVMEAAHHALSERAKKLYAKQWLSDGVWHVVLGAISDFDQDCNDARQRHLDELCMDKPMPLSIPQSDICVSTVDLARSDHWLKRVGQPIVHESGYPALLSNNDRLPNAPRATSMESFLTQVGSLGVSMHLCDVPLLRCVLSAPMPTDAAWPAFIDQSGDKGELMFSLSILLERFVSYWSQQPNYSQSRLVVSLVLFNMISELFLTSKGNEGGKYVLSLDQSFFNQIGSVSDPGLYQIVSRILMCLSDREKGRQKIFGLHLDFSQPLAETAFIEGCLDQVNLAEFKDMIQASDLDPELKNLAVLNACIFGKHHVYTAFCRKSSHFLEKLRGFLGFSRPIFKLIVACHAVHHIGQKMPEVAYEGGPLYDQQGYALGFDWLGTQGLEAQKERHGDLANRMHVKKPYEDHMASLMKAGHKDLFSKEKGVPCWLLPEVFPVALSLASTHDEAILLASVFQVPALSLVRSAELLWMHVNNPGFASKIIQAVREGLLCERYIKFCMQSDCLRSAIDLLQKSLTKIVLDPNAKIKVVIDLVDLMFVVKHFCYEQHRAVYGGIEWLRVSDVTARFSPHHPANLDPAIMRVYGALRMYDYLSLWMMDHGVKSPYAASRLDSDVIAEFASLGDAIPWAEVIACNVFIRCSKNDVLVRLMEHYGLFLVEAARGYLAKDEIQKKLLGILREEKYGMWPHIQDQGDGDVWHLLDVGNRLSGDLPMVLTKAGVAGLLSLDVGEGRLFVGHQIVPLSHDDVMEARMKHVLQYVPDAKNRGWLIKGCHLVSEETSPEWVFGFGRRGSLAKVTRSIMLDGKPCVVGYDNMLPFLKRLFGYVACSNAFILSDQEQDKDKAADDCGALFLPVRGSSLPVLYFKHHISNYFDGERCDAPRVMAIEAGNRLVSSNMFLLTKHGKSSPSECYKYWHDRLMHVMPKDREAVILMRGGASNAVVASIYLEPFGLRFQRGVDDRMHCTSHEGYYLSEHATHPAIEGYPGVLCLDHVHGAPVMLLMPKYVYKDHNESVGSFEVNKSVMHPGYYQYFIDHEGFVSSPEPLAMLYLSCFYLLKNRYGQARWCLEKSNHAGYDDKFMNDCMLNISKLNFYAKRGVQVLGEMKARAQRHVYGINIDPKYITKKPVRCVMTPNVSSQGGIDVGGREGLIRALSHGNGDSFNFYTSGMKKEDFNGFKTILNFYSDKDSKVIKFKLPSAEVYAGCSFVPRKIHVGNGCVSGPGQASKVVELVCGVPSLSRCLAMAVSSSDVDRRALYAMLYSQFFSEGHVSSSNVFYMSVVLHVLLGRDKVYLHMSPDEVMVAICKETKSDGFIDKMMPYIDAFHDRTLMREFFDSPQLCDAVSSTKCQQPRTIEIPQFTLPEVNIKVSMSGAGGRAIGAFATAKDHQSVIWSLTNADVHRALRACSFSNKLVSLDMTNLLGDVITEYFSEMPCPSASPAFDFVSSGDSDSNAMKSTKHQLSEAMQARKTVKGHSFEMREAVCKLMHDSVLSMIKSIDGDMATLHGMCVALFSAEPDFRADDLNDSQSRSFLARSSGTVRPITMDLIIEAVLSGDISVLRRSNPWLSDTNIDEALPKFAALCILTALRQRLVDVVSMLSDVEEVGLSVAEEMVHLLTVNVDMDYATYPECLVFMYQAGKVLSPKQYQAFVGVTSQWKSGEQKGHQLLQLPAGAGKTSCLIPMFSYWLAKHGKLPMVITTPELYGFALRDLPPLLQKCFNQRVEVLQFDLCHDWYTESLGRLRQLKSRLEAWRQDRCCVIIESQTWHSMNLAAKNPELHAQNQGILREVCEFIRMHAVKIEDECHVVSDAKHEHVIACGGLTPLPERHRSMFLCYYDVLFNHTGEHGVIAGHAGMNTMSKTLVRDDKREAIVKALVAHVIKHYFEERFFSGCQDIRDYLLDPQTHRPDWLKEMHESEPDHANDVVLARAFLHTHLPLLLRYQLDKDYGRSVHEGDLAAAPWDDGEKTTSHFADPYLKLALTIQLYFQRGIEHKDGLLVADTMASMLKQHVHQKRKSSLTRVQAGYDAGVTTHSKAPAISFDEMPEVVLHQMAIKDDFSMHPMVTRQFLLAHVFPQILCSSDSIVSTPADLAAGFASGVSLSATPGAPAVYPALTKCWMDADFMGNVLCEMFEGKNSRIEVMPAVDPSSMVGVLDRYGAGACIDQGGLLSVPLLKGVLHAMCYFDHGAIHLLGGDKDVVLSKRQASGVLAGSEGSKPVMVFDLAHTTGVDISLPADTRAVVTVGKFMTLSQMIQAVMRMRKLLHRHGQTVTWVITEALAKVLSPGGGRITLSDLLRYFLANEVQDEADKILQCCYQAITFIVESHAKKPKVVSVSNDPYDRYEKEPQSENLKDILDDFVSAKCEFFGVTWDDLSAGDQSTIKELIENTCAQLGGVPQRVDRGLSTVCTQQQTFSCTTEVTKETTTTTGWSSLGSNHAIRTEVYSPDSHQFITKGPAGWEKVFKLKGIEDGLLPEVYYNQPSFDPFVNAEHEKAGCHAIDHVVRFKSVAGLLIKHDGAGFSCLLLTTLGIDHYLRQIDGLHAGGGRADEPVAYAVLGLDHLAQYAKSEGFDGIQGACVYVKRMQCFALFLNGYVQDIDAWQALIRENTWTFDHLERIIDALSAVAEQHRYSEMLLSASEFDALDVGSGRCVYHAGRLFGRCAWAKQREPVCVPVTDLVVTPTAVLCPNP